MALPVSLQAVVDQMDVINDEVVAYINRKNGELVSLTAEDISLAEGHDDSFFIPEWQRDLVDKAKQALNDDDYLELPDRFEIGEYCIMERYCYSIEEERVRQALLRAINARAHSAVSRTRFTKRGSTRTGISSGPKPSRRSRPIFF